MTALSDKDIMQKSKLSVDSCTKANSFVLKNRTRKTDQSDALPRDVLWQRNPILVLLILQSCLYGDKILNKMGFVDSIYSKNYLIGIQSQYSAIFLQESCINNTGNIAIKDIMGYQHLVEKPRVFDPRGQATVPLRAKI